MNKGKVPDVIIKELESRISTVVSVLQHYGEAGRNVEDIIRQTLREYLPMRFGIETGFVRSLEKLNWQSKQIDILFTRQDTGHPLFVFPGTKIFPIESIIGFMEVTSNLNSKKLDDDFRKVSGLKHKQKRSFTLSRYAARIYGYLPPIKYKSKKEELLERITRIGIQIKDLQPRFFYFAFSTKWKNPITICRNLALAGKKYKAHLHGMFILNRGYFKHTPTNDPKQAYHISYITDIPRAYIIFIHDLIDSLQTFTTLPESSTIPISGYHFVDARYQQWKHK